MKLYVVEVLDDRGYFEPYLAYETLKPSIENAMFLEKKKEKYVRVIKNEVIWEDGIWLDTEDNI